MPKKLHDLVVDFISLVKHPATDKGIILKSGQQAQSFKIIKTDDELQRAYGIVYAPNQVDLQGDSTDVQTIRTAADHFMREGRQKNIDVEHSFEPQENVYVAESWLVRQPDSLFSDEPDGAWAVGIQIKDADVWQRLKKGELTGISLAGTATVAEEPNKENDTPPRWFQNQSEPTNNSVGLAETITTEVPNREKSEMSQDELIRFIESTIKSYLTKSGIKIPQLTDEQVDEQTAVIVEQVAKKLENSMAKYFKKGTEESGALVANSEFESSYL
ncbi:MAG: hypothetical protein B6247_03980 [Candidatus Parabeggiatoa sp. nov. 2]|nr:MAG: hypothetical protein B6247_03980 [Beggiatoa sp. 4572_84]